MIQLTDKEIKGKLVELLNSFDKLCKDNNLRYCLAYGTLLGAIRHKGFIPWDDDIDVWMPIDDYKKLLNLTINSSKYKLVYDNDENYNLNYAKYYDDSTILSCDYMNYNYGVFIDVFPMHFVNIPSNKVKKVKKKNNFYYKMISYCAMKKYWPSKNVLKNFIKKISYTFSKIKGYSYWNSRLNKYIDKYKNQDTNNYAISSDSVMHFTNFFDNLENAYFEDILVYIPRDYDKILKEYYGDYMKLPPLEERISSHDFTAFNK